MRVMKIILRIISIVLTVLLALILCFNLYMIAAQRIFKVRQPTVLGFSCAIVATGSMSGSIKPDDLIITRKRDRYEIGDIITYYGKTSTVTHRITNITADGFITKGDANNAPDPVAVKPADIVGKVVLIVPRFGETAEFFSSAFGLILLAVGIFIISALPTAINRFSK